MQGFHLACLNFLIRMPLILLSLNKLTFIVHKTLINGVIILLCTNTAHKPSMRPRVHRSNDYNLVIVTIL
jgi:hypothetical protein